jgi:hypothetical protein
MAAEAVASGISEHPTFSIEILHYCGSSTSAPDRNGVTAMQAAHVGWEIGLSLGWPGFGKMAGQ